MKRAKGDAAGRFDAAMEEVRRDKRKAESCRQHTEDENKRLRTEVNQVSTALTSALERTLQLRDEGDAKDRRIIQLEKQVTELNGLLLELQSDLDQAVSGKVASAIGGAIAAGKEERVLQFLRDSLKDPLAEGDEYAGMTSNAQRRVRDKVTKLVRALAKAVGSRHTGDYAAVVERFTSHAQVQALTGSKKTSETDAKRNDTKVTEWVLKAVAKRMAGELKSGRGSGKICKAKQMFLQIIGEVPNGLGRAFGRIFNIDRKSASKYLKRRAKRADLQCWTELPKATYRNKVRDATVIGEDWRRQTRCVPGKVARRRVGPKRFKKHMVHYKFYTVDKMYAEFLGSVGYAQWRSDNTGAQNLNGI